MILILGDDPKPEVNSAKGLGGFVGTIEINEMQKEKLQKCARGQDIGDRISTFGAP